jgi:hypothetical protein
MGDWQKNPWTARSAAPLSLHVTNNECFIARDENSVACDESSIACDESSVARDGSSVACQLSVHAGEPHIAGILQNDRLVGATAVDVLAGMLQRNEHGLPGIITCTLVDGTWQPGKTVRRLSLKGR